jgi:hypothetical protein
LTIGRHFARFAGNWCPQLQRFIIDDRAEAGAFIVASANGAEIMHLRRAADDPLARRFKEKRR